DRRIHLLEQARMVIAHFTHQFYDLALSLFCFRVRVDPCQESNRLLIQSCRPITLHTCGKLVSNGPVALSKKHPAGHMIGLRCRLVACTKTPSWVLRKEAKVARPFFAHVATIAVARTFVRNYDAVDSAGL